jgi:hypothetical protein
MKITRRSALGMPAAAPRYGAPPAFDVQPPREFRITLR